MAKSWMGSWPAECDICNQQLADELTFVDGKTIHGPWALMCEGCHKLQGVGIGTGRGQRYDSKTREKIEG